MHYSSLIPLSVSILLSSPFVSALPVTSSATPTNTTSNAETITAITNVLSLFSQTLDTKNFSALGDVFSQNAILGGGNAPQNITGLAAITKFYSAQFPTNSNLSTQHTSDTVYVNDITSNTASSVSYANAFYFGPKVLSRGGEMFANQSVVFREMFTNQYVKGADGSWKISLQTGPEVLSIEGDTSIIPPPPPAGQD